jgi:hypothetical protein
VLPRDDELACTAVAALPPGPFPVSPSSRECLRCQRHDEPTVPEEAGKRGRVQGRTVRERRRSVLHFNGPLAWLIGADIELLASSPGCAGRGSDLQNFEIIGALHELRTIATGGRIRELQRLIRRYGGGRWRKCKALATIRLSDGTIREAEIHWYEAAAIGRKEFKIKRYLTLP